MTLNELEQKARFEEWLGRQPTECGYRTITVEQAGGNSGDDRYLSPTTSLAWSAWQAALQQAQQPGAQAVATVKSWVNGSHQRHYTLEWHRTVERGTQLYTAPPPRCRRDSEGIM